MIRRTKAWFAILGATALLAPIVGAASARNLSFSSQTIRATWTAMEFIQRSAGVTLRCPATLEGSLHARTIAKVLNTPMGYITRAAFREASCSGGSIRVRSETLPWHIRYLGFTGTLPNITSIRENLVNLGFDITASFFGINVMCSYRTGATTRTFNREAGGGLTTATLEATNLPPDQGFPCEPIELGGTSNSVTVLTVLNATTRITVTLI
jgi:hypothetical protein